MRKIKGIVVLLISLVFVNLAFAGDSAKQSIIEGNAKLMKAFGHDASFIASLYTKNGQLMPAGAEAIEGHVKIAEFWQGVFDAGITGVTLETLEVSTMGDTASEVGALKLKNKEGKVIDTGKYVVVWKRIDGKWKLHRDIWTSNTP